MAETRNTSPRTLRADARRNRDAMIAAARRVFAREGLDAPLDLVAAEAGVARATQYRHFPTRESLIGSIYEDCLDEVKRTIKATCPPEEAYWAAVSKTAEIQLRDRGFLELFARRGVYEEIKQEIGARYLAAVRPALRVAQGAGRIRADLRLEDTMLLIAMAGASVKVPGPAGEDDVQLPRALELLRDALTPAPNRGRERSKH